MVFLMIYIIIGAVLAVLICTIYDKVGEEELHSYFVTTRGFTSVVADALCDQIYRPRIKVLALYNVTWPAIIVTNIYGAINTTKKK